MLKNKLCEICGICVIVFGIILCGSSCTSYHGENNEAAIEMITAFITQRYHQVSLENVDVVYEESRKYYSQRLVDIGTAWGLDGQQQEESKKYFEETGYLTSVETVYVEPNGDSKYLAKAAVVFFTNEHTYDMVVNYAFEIRLTQTDKNELLIDDIICVSNEALAITNGIIHVDAGVAHVPDQEETCDHKH